MAVALARMDGGAACALGSTAAGAVRGPTFVLRTSDWRASFTEALTSRGK
jgi:hypothetical protein